eukprot:859989-Rhodomonas_salina.1
MCNGVASLRSVIPLAFAFATGFLMQTFFRDDNYQLLAQRAAMYKPVRVFSTSASVNHGLSQPTFISSPIPADQATAAPKRWPEASTSKMSGWNLGASSLAGLKELNLNLGTVNNHHPHPSYTNYVAVQHASACGANQTCGPWCVCHDFSQAFGLGDNSVRH